MDCGEIISDEPLALRSREWEILSALLLNGFGVTIRDHDHNSFVWLDILGPRTTFVWITRKEGTK